MYITVKKDLYIYRDSSIFAGFLTPTAVVVVIPHLHLHVTPRWVERLRESLEPALAVDTAQQEEQLDGQMEHPENSPR